MLDRGHMWWRDCPTHCFNRGASVGRAVIGISPRGVQFSKRLHYFFLSRSNHSNLSGSKRKELSGGLCFYLLVAHSHNRKNTRTCWAVVLHNKLRLKRGDAFSRAPLSNHGHSHVPRWHEGSRRCVRGVKRVRGEVREANQSHMRLRAPS